MWVADKIVLIIRVSDGEYENTYKKQPSPSVYDMLGIHSLFYNYWFLDCEHWIGDVKENSCGISLLNFTLGKLCTQSCFLVCVDFCYYALNTIGCNN